LGTEGHEKGREGEKGEEGQGREKEGVRRRGMESQEWEWTHSQDGSRTTGC